MMSISCEELRLALSDAGLEKYSDVVCAHLDELCAASSQREQLERLKEVCAVKTLGHRHRLVALLSATSTATSDGASSSEAAVYSATSDGASSSSSEAAVYSIDHHAHTTPPAHITAMVTQCEKLEGPLPFHYKMGNKQARTIGDHLALDLSYPGLWRVHTDPPIYLCEGLATAAECDALMRLADPLLLRSKTESGESRSRTSRSCHLRKESVPCPELMRKLRALTGKPPAEMECPQVARYEPGQFYTMHFDGSDEVAAASGSHFLKQGGQRVGTCLIYLNDVARGGRTRFNRLGIEVSPRKGTAVLFFPGFADGDLDERALHEALPAVDRKYVCQIWIRQYTLPPEPATGLGGGMGHLLLEALHSR